MGSISLDNIIIGLIIGIASGVVVIAWLLSHGSGISMTSTGPTSAHSRTFYVYPGESNETEIYTDVD